VESSISEQIILYRQGSSRSLVSHADLCRALCGIVLRAGPPLAARPMYSHVGIRGHTPIGTKFLSTQFYHRKSGTKFSVPKKGSLHPS
jgi:hypothetical protein